MKKLIAICVVTLLVCFAFSTVAQAVLIREWAEWRFVLDAGQSITTINHYAFGPDSLKYIKMEWTPTYDAADINKDGWELKIFDDVVYGPNSIAALYSNINTPATNDSASPVAWFSYKIEYEWDDVDPVQFDIILWDDDTQVTAQKKQGVPGASDPNWTTTDALFRDTNPYESIVEPTTVCLFGLGSAFLIRKRTRAKTKKG